MHLDHDIKMFMAEVFFNTPPPNGVNQYLVMGYTFNILWYVHIIEYNIAIKYDVLLEIIRIKIVDIKYLIVDIKNRAQYLINAHSMLTFSLFLLVVVLLLLSYLKIGWDVPICKMKKSYKTVCKLWYLLNMYT